jgi:FixJ family two-component response regulator
MVAIVDDDQSVQRALKDLMESAGTLGAVFRISGRVP